MRDRPFIFAKDKDVDHDEPASEMLPRSDGTRIVLFPSVGDTGPEYAIGMEPQNMWFNTSGPATGYKFYFGSVQRYLFDQNNLTLPAAPTANMHAATKQYVDQNSSSIGAWQAVTLTGAGSAPTDFFCRSVPGGVQIKGSCIHTGSFTAPNTLSAIATLPAGLRPNTDRRFPILAYLVGWPGAAYQATYCQVQSSGVIAVTIPLNSPGGTGIRFYFDNIILPTN